jgi:hypothetical protein
MGCLTLWKTVIKTAIDNKNFRKTKFSQGIYYLLGVIDNKLFDETNFCQTNSYD